MAAYDFALCGGDILLRRYNELRDVGNELEQLVDELIAESAPSAWIHAVIRMIECYRADASQIRCQFERIGFIDQNFARRAS